MMIAEQLSLPPDVQPISNSTSLGAFELHRGWDVVDSQLAGWIPDPESLVDYDAVPPSRTLIRKLRDFVIPLLKQQQWPAPTMVVPDGDGGISFEFHSGNIFRHLEFLRDGEVRLATFRNGRLQSRRLLAV
jgi:hypothetical protein